MISIIGKLKAYFKKIIDKIRHQDIIDGLEGIITKQEVNIIDLCKAIDIANEIIKEMIKRRNEVCQRLIYAANRRFPPYILEMEGEIMPELFRWVSEPHISPEFTPYLPTTGEVDRGAEHAVYKILKNIKEVESEND